VFISDNVKNTLVENGRTISAEMKDLSSLLGKHLSFWNRADMELKWLIRRKLQHLSAF